MAEEGGAPVISNQRLLVIVGAVIVGIAVFFLWTFRGCIPAIPKGMRGDDGYVKIYTNLELKDAANTITRLKELKIPYKISDNGSAVSVPKDKADDAKLGLAEKNLPQGGAVGWEIFNETRMGATDFDRRIQLIRAISGELSRTIRRIEGVEDARVQIVLPETRLFEVSKAPVTAAVLLRITPGKHLRPDQVNGIIHLVASSVENLQPENVTIVDDEGNILTARTKAPPPEETAEQVPVKTLLPAPIEQQVIKKEEAKPSPLVMPTKTQEAQQAVVAKPKVLTEEEKALLKLRAKEEYERQLTARVQELLSQLYPPNKVIVRVSVLFGEPKAGGKATKLKIRSDAGAVFAPVKRITSIVLIDNKIKLSAKIKKSTYQTIALAIPYDKKRGDKIILKQVPFHYASITPEKIKQVMPKFSLPIALTIPKLGKYSNYAMWGGGVLLLIILFLIIRRIMRPRQRGFMREEMEAPSAPSETEATTTVKQIKDLAKENPERLANLLKKWLSEAEQ